MTLRHLQVLFAFSVKLYMTEKNSRVFRDMKSVSSFFLCKCPKVFVTVQKNLVLVAVAGKNIFNQRFGAVKENRVIIKQAVDGGKTGKKDVASVFQSKLFIQFFGGKYNTAVKLPDKLTDLFHMVTSIGAAQKTAVRAQYPADFRAYMVEISAVKKYMVGDYKVKTVIRKRNVCAVKGMKRKTAVILSDISSGIPKHTF